MTQADAIETETLMGINSYITHRMFVAALSHEESTADLPSSHRQREEAQAKRSVGSDPEKRFSAVEQAEAAVRRWRATTVTTLL